MKKVTFILSSVILMTISSVNVIAQSNASATANSSARIIEHITLSYEDQPLAFGSIIKDADGGTVIIAAETGNVSYTNLPEQLTTTTSAAAFKVTGEVGYVFSLALPLDDVVVLTGPAGSTPMSIDAFNSTINDDTNNTIPLGGEVNFNVGATLTVNPSQMAGNYAGTFDVTVTYE
jgi:hypothetical protein